MASKNIKNNKNNKTDESLCISVLDFISYRPSDPDYRRCVGNVNPRQRCSSQIGKNKYEVSKKKVHEMSERTTSNVTLPEMIDTTRDVLCRDHPEQVKIVAPKWANEMNDWICRKQANSKGDDKNNDDNAGEGPSNSKKSSGRDSSKRK